jgi:hypothetical protein
MDSTPVSSQPLMCSSNTLIPGVWVIPAGANLTTDTPHKVATTCSHCNGSESWLSVYTKGVEICGSDHITYNSQQHFDAARCKVMGNVTKLDKLKDGPCGCLSNNGGCVGGHCDDTTGKVKCSCQLGVLASDNRTCDITDYIYFGEGPSFKLMDSNGQQSILYHESDYFIVTATHDYQTATLFFVAYDYQNHQSHFVRILVRSQTIKLLTSAQGLVKRMAMDSSEESIFYTSDTKVRQLRNVYSESPVDAHVATLTEPTELVLHPCQRLLFVTDVGEHNIYSLNLNTGTKHVVASGLRGIHGLTIDRDNEKLYWGDSYYDVLEESNYDGSCRRAVGFTTGSHLYALSYWNGHLLWTNDRDYENNNAIVRYTRIDDGTTTNWFSSQSALFDIGVFVNNTNGHQLVSIGVDVGRHFIVHHLQLSRSSISFGQ